MDKTMEVSYVIVIKQSRRTEERGDALKKPTKSLIASICLTVVLLQVYIQLLKLINGTESVITK